MRSLKAVVLACALLPACATLPPGPGYASVSAGNARYYGPASPYPYYPYRGPAFYGPPYYGPPVYYGPSPGIGIYRGRSGRFRGLR